MRIFIFFRRATHQLCVTYNNEIQHIGNMFLLYLKRALIKFRKCVCSFLVGPTYFTKVKMYGAPSIKTYKVNCEVSSRRLLFVNSCKQILQKAGIVEQT